MKTEITTYRKSLTEKVVENFLEKKTTFNLDADEKGNLHKVIMKGLIHLFEEYNLVCLDINQFFVFGVSYYSFVFRDLQEDIRVQRKNTMCSACIHFMNDFTDNDGSFINFQSLSGSNGIYQFNFSIS